MQQVDFYILSQPNFLSCQRFVCQLVEKIFSASQNLVIHCESIIIAKSLDQQLWSWSDSSFIPHHLDENNTDIIIADQANSTAQIMLNMSLTENPRVLNEQRLLQIVPNDPQCLQWARNHYKHYKSLHYKVNSHKINER